MRDNSTYWGENTQSMVFTTPLPSKDIMGCIPKNSFILDFGCGYGRIVEYIEKLGYSNYLGIDISNDLVLRAKQYHPNYNFEVASLKDLIRRNMRFDVIIIMGVIENIFESSDRNIFVKELFELLNGDGIVYLETFLLDDLVHKEKYIFAQKNGYLYGTLILNDGNLILFHDTEKGIDKLFCSVGFVKQKSSKAVFKTWNDKSVLGCEVIFKKP